MDFDVEGKEVLKCGFKIGGGIDQNYKKSPQGYTDNVSANKCIQTNYIQFCIKNGFILKFLLEILMLYLVNRVFM